MSSISGLRLDDIDGLEAEPAADTKTNEHKLREQLRKNGASDEEIERLLVERVELNAMGSAELIAFIEDKLQEKKTKLAKLFPTASFWITPTANLSAVSA